MAHAYIFRRKIGCPIPELDGNAGHVGWAFDLTDGAGICCGSTENFGFRPWVEAGGDNSAWGETFPTLEAVEEKMRSLKYDDYKIVEVPKPNAKQALIVSDNNAKIGYSFVGNNCLDHAYQVLAQYGALELPIPIFHAIPNAWFNTVHGHRVIL